MAKSSMFVVFEEFVKDSPLRETLYVSKNLVKRFNNFELSAYVSTLIGECELLFDTAPDTMHYLGFPFPHKRQREIVFFSEAKLRRYKKQLQKLGILKIERHGMPPTEFYFLNFDLISEWM